MTIGPYQATGSWIGLPDTSRNANPFVTGLDGDLVAGVEQHERAVADFFPHENFVAVDLLFTEHADRLGRGAERAIAFKHIGKGVALDLDLERLAFASRDKNVEVPRIGGDAVDRPFLAPESRRTQLARVCRRRR